MRLIMINLNKNFLTFLLFSTFSLNAAENGNYSYMPGSSSFFSAAIPPVPGLYYLNQLTYFHQESLYDAHGKKKNVGLDAEGFVNNFRFINVWDVKPFGMTAFSSQLIIPIGRLRMNLSTYNQKGHDWGIGDVIFNPVYGKWQLTTYFHMTAGLDFVLPTGGYDKKDAISMGKNYWSIQPVFGFRYDNPDGIDIAINPRYSFNTKNDDTNYISGESLFIDFILGWHFGSFEPAILGGFWKQIGSDKNNGHEIGNRARKLTIGPGFSYQWRQYNFIIQYQHDYFVENSSGGDTLWFNISMPLAINNM
ncbi:transporter [Citrobacter sp. Cb004]|uniref:SphA family protein n=1 Tax=Citrobacter sp. Cb004 TaxID=2985006 RepID=UPI002574AAC8|nr:transporter [Citrobacter sp. Cb004]MDM3354953.1 transporter [Citrobacter sp. Cb004]